VSACIITKNEARHIAACIGSLSFADEVVVVDAESTDDTARIARELGARVISQPFLGHVRQKQLAVDAAANDWVFCIDADERVDAAQAGGIAAALAAQDDGIAGYEVARHVHYLGRPIDHGGWWPEWRLRLFDRRRGRWTGTDPHDRVEVDGRTRRLPGELLHFNYRDLAHHAEKINAYTSIMADRAVQAGRRFRWIDLLVRPPARFLRMYVLRGGFRDGARGFLLAWMASFYVFLKYAKLWEHANAPPPDAGR
jgi:glycosyltransferase involved in cell wall biosynthesis